MNHTKFIWPHVLSIVCNYTKYIQLCSCLMICNHDKYIRLYVWSNVWNHTRYNPNTQKVYRCTITIIKQKKLHRRNKIVRRETLVIRRMFLHYMFERILGMQKMILIDIQKLNRIKREREHPQKYFAWKYQSIRK